MSSIATRPKICTNLLNGAKLQFSTSTIRLKSHYDTLGITPKATQSDIKTAYYELTKVYHPDKNKSEEAKQKFRNITDAYETLGNYKSRRMYDRGMRPDLRQPEPRNEEEIQKEDAQTRFYRSRLNRNKVTAPGGRTPIYNFDEWTRAHYGELFNRNIRVKKKFEDEERIKREEDVVLKDQKLWFPILLVFFTITIALLTSNINDNYDQDKINPRRKESRSSP